MFACQVRKISRREQQQIQFLENAALGGLLLATG
jgi:hypothetical protein